MKGAQSDKNLVIEHVGTIDINTNIKIYGWQAPTKSLK